MVNWEQLGACPVCNAAAGEPCRDLRFRGRRAYAEWPHKGRPRRQVR
jgi:hypothetical protein